MFSVTPSKLGVVLHSKVWLSALRISVDADRNNPTPVCQNCKEKYSVTCGTTIQCTVTTERRKTHTLVWETVELETEPWLLRSLFAVIYVPCFSCFSSLKCYVVGGSCSSVQLKITLSQAPLYTAACNNYFLVGVFLLQNSTDCQSEGLCPVYPCAAECTQLYIALDAELSMDSTMSCLSFHIFTGSCHIWSKSKHDEQVHRWTDTNWLIFSQCSGLRTPKYIQYVCLLMILNKSVRCFEIEKPPQASLWWYTHQSVDMKSNRLHPLLFLIPYVLVCICRFWLEFSV